MLQLLRDEQKQHHMSVCSELKELLLTDPNFFSHVVTGSESWVYGYDPETTNGKANFTLPKKSLSNQKHQIHIQN